MAKGAAQVPGGKKIHAAGLTRPHRVTVAPNIVRPIYDFSVGRERRLDPHRHSRTERRPGELVVPHPLKLDGRACDGTGHQSRVQGHVVGTVVAVASGSGHVNDIDLSVRHSQHFGQISPQGKRALRVGPHRHATVLQPCDRARGADRCVRQVRAGILGTNSLDLVWYRLGLTGGTYDDRLRAKLLQLAAQIGNIGKWDRVVAPARCRRQGIARGDRLLLALCGNRKKIAVPNDRDHAGKRSNRGFVERDQFRSVARRTDNSRKDHPRQPHILHVGRRTGQLSGQVDPIDRLADDGIVARLLRRCGGCDVSLQQIGICVRDFPEGRALPVRRGDDAVLDLQIFRADAEPPRRRRKKNAARFARLPLGWRFHFARPIDYRRCTARPVPVRCRRETMRIFSNPTSSSSAAI